MSEMSEDNLRAPIANSARVHPVSCCWHPWGGAPSAACRRDRIADTVLSIRASHVGCFTGEHQDPTTAAHILTREITFNLHWE